MNIKKLFILGLRAIILTVLLFICFAVAAVISGTSDGSHQSSSSPQTSTEQGSTALALLVVCLVDVLIIMYIIERSRWRGLRLAASIFIIFYGTMTVMPQIESAIFITRLPAGVLPGLFMMGAIIAALFSPLAVMIMGKWKQTTPDQQSTTRLVMPASEWAWKLAAIAIAYLLLYFTFGYFIAWVNPSIREYYGGDTPAGFFAHLLTLLRDTPWLFVIQLLRGLMWALLALPLIRLMKGDWWEAALAVSLVFAVVMNVQLLLPNPYMPEDVRMIHLIETASSNFILGWLIVWLLTRQRKPAMSAKLPATA